ncbi:replication-relaxation family protein [Paenibacillus macquariensis]|uniref:Replication-relaxation n=1 Tax=Paenibacillus macquariensis TaxID=948756 RepID=A0ABY1KEK8_9BACL|nr:replication-relaxation family protein [Paenibacillus macquariensis]OAB28465.1 hypothetical protein PMSM_24380 [Paenibacillus macquariensis subsp. macquariensis]SIR71871.1 Replication-relaxation [Paenibacillus macquariensis]
MLFKWVDHDRLTRVEQLQNIIFDMGIATAEQLMAITGMQYDNLRYHIHKIQKSGRDMLRVYYLPAKFGVRKRGAYTLGPDSIRLVCQMRNAPETAKVITSAMMMHHIGTNDILLRAKKHSELNRLNIDWTGEKLSTELLYLDLLEIDPEEANRPGFKRQLRPDAKLTVGSAEFFIEFDNDTENPRRIEEKYRRYIELHEKLNFTSPILWVAPNEKRYNVLKTNWQSLLNGSFQHQNNKPTSIFAIAGDETKFYPIRKKSVTNSN